MLASTSQCDQDRIRILCVGAHSDDIEIGCGARSYGCCRNVRGDRSPLGRARLDRRTRSRSRDERGKLRQHKQRVTIKDFEWPRSSEELKERFEALKRQVSPDVIFTHARHDLHQDHRFVNQLTWNTFRDHLILEYEIPKYDGDMGAPNLFVHLDEAICEKKVALLMAHFQTQRDKDWFTPDLFRSLLRLRGMESRAPGKYAEGFYCRKIVL
jgi:LmbE family N-acetylglucosaminyl deacetylase